MCFMCKIPNWYAWTYIGPSDIQEPTFPAVTNENKGKRVKWKKESNQLFGENRIKCCTN